MVNGSPSVVMTMSMTFSNSRMVGIMEVLALTGMMNLIQMTGRERLSRPSKRRRSLVAVSDWASSLLSSMSVHNDGSAFVGCVVFVMLWRVGTLIQC